MAAENPNLDAFLRENGIDTGIIYAHANEMLDPEKPTGEWIIWVEMQAYIISKTEKGFSLREAETAKAS